MTRSTLDSLCELITDGAHKSPREFPHGIPMMSVKDMTDKSFSYDNCKTISTKDAQELIAGGCRPKIGDVLIAKDGSVLKHVFTVRGPADYVLLSSIAIIRPKKDKLISEFLEYMFKNPQFKLMVLSSFLGGSGVPRIVLRDFKKVLIDIPPLQEQKAIAEVLSSLDDKIELLQKQNETLEALAQTLFRQWFIEEADDSWEEAFLSDEFNLTMGQSPPGTSYNESALGTPMYQGNADFSFRFPVKRVFTTEPKRLAEKYDTLISVRAPVGAQNMAFEECCIGRGVAAISHPKGYFSYTYYKVNSIMKQISAFNDTGTVFGSISKKDLERISITIPPAELIEKFNEVGGSLEVKVHHNEESINNLKVTRDALLPKLMSGQVRVKLD